jgi:hypothetical protein
MVLLQCTFQFGVLRVFFGPNQNRIAVFCCLGRTFPIPLIGYRVELTFLLPKVCLECSPSKRLAILPSENNITLERTEANSGEIVFPLGS